jgi:multiple sugar transport system substrate-binding protein
MTLRWTRRILLAAAVVVALPACGGDSAAAPVDPGWIAERTAIGRLLVTPGSARPLRPARTVNYCSDFSEDTPEREKAVQRFSRATEGLVVNRIDVGSGTNEQHGRFLELYAQGRDRRCDVFDADVIWMAELAKTHRIRNMTPYLRSRAQGFLRDRDHPPFIANTLRTACYDGEYWGVPHDSNAGFVFSRREANRKEVPWHEQTWQDIYKSAPHGPAPGFLYQAGGGEPLTVNFLEIAYANGGRVLSSDGTTSLLDSDHNRKALQFMVSGIGSAAPPEVLRMDEEATTREFSQGRGMYMRNWPSEHYVLTHPGTGRDKVDVDVSPLPVYDGGGIGGVLGGANLVIAANATEPEAALALIHFLTKADEQTIGLRDYRTPAVVNDAYDRVIKGGGEAVEFTRQLRRALAQGLPRPVTPVWDEISEKIAKHVHRALSGKTERIERSRTPTPT